MNIMCRSNNNYSTNPYITTSSSSKCYPSHLATDENASVVTASTTNTDSSTSLPMSVADMESCSFAANDQTTTTTNEKQQHQEQRQPPTMTSSCTSEDVMKSPQVLNNKRTIPFTRSDSTNTLLLSPLSKEFREMQKVIEQMKNCAALNFNPLEITPSVKKKHYVSTTTKPTSSSTTVTATTPTTTAKLLTVSNKARESTGITSPRATTESSSTSSPIADADGAGNSSSNSSDGSTLSNNNPKKYNPSHVHATEVAPSSPNKISSTDKVNDDVRKRKTGNENNLHLKQQLLQEHRRIYQQKIAMTKLADLETRKQVEARLQMLRNKKAARIAKAKAKGLL